MLSISVNGKTHNLDVDPDTPLLWVLRDSLKLTGTKYGCGIGQCGTCTVLVNGVATRSCQTPLHTIKNQSVTTIEGLESTLGKKIKQAWLDADVAQCGFCQPGQIMSATSLLTQTPRPTPSEVNQAMDGILCRCGTYNRVRQAIADVATTLVEK